ncbi:MAG: IS4 family transposase, partial [Rikenellaceae bacterium]
GQPLYSQILKLVDKAKIIKISRNGNHDRYVKRLDGYTHFVALLFAVLQRYDSLRELVVGMLSEANKLQHLGIDYMIKRSTIADANNRRKSSFFASIYERYRGVLSDSRTPKPWEKRLYIMDSTTISLFSNILKGVGRNPKHGKKKGGIKAHSVIKAIENAPCFVCYTSAATHDHFMLEKLHLEPGSYLAIDRAYLDYEQLERLTQEGVYYVSKMKSNLTYKTLEATTYVNPEGLVTFRERIVLFTKSTKQGIIEHRSRIVEYWAVDAKGKLSHAQLLTNNFELPLEDVVEIYKRRWQIETLFKQLKQNFQLRYFYGDSVNAIESQIWVTLIANLLLTIIKRQVKRRWSFSNMATMIRQMLMYYIDLYKYLEDPEKSWLSINTQRAKSPPEPTLFSSN